MADYKMRTGSAPGADLGLSKMDRVGERKCQVKLGREAVY